MRVLFFVGGFPELSETFVLDQIVGLLDRGHDVTVFARRPSDARGMRSPLVASRGLLERTCYWDAAGAVRLRAIPSVLKAVAQGAHAGSKRATGAPATLLRQALALRTLPAPDVVVAHFGPNAVAAQALRDLGVLSAPLLAFFHGYDLSRVVRARGRDYYAPLFARGERMLPVSHCFAERLIALGCPPAKVHVHSMGVRTQQLRFRERSLEPTSHLRFLSVCRLVEKKGIAIGLQAFARVHRELPRATWDVAGDGPLRAALEAQCAALGLAGVVRFHGACNRERVGELLGRSHVLIAPSLTASDGDQEGVPVSIMEAMASGLPVVATRHSGIPELVRHADTGLLVAERDTDQLARALIAIGSAPERWAAMGREGRAVIERGHDLDALNARLERMLRELCPPPRPRRHDDARA